MTGFLDDGSIPCSRWANGPSTAPKSCTERASRFFFEDGALGAFCQSCRNDLLGIGPSGEISREEYLRLAEVSEVMSS